MESKERNWIRIYEDPIDDDPYVLGGDTKGEGSDFYTGTVVNNITGNRAATLHRNLNISKPYTHQMYCLGMYYNTALVGIEINFNTGVIEEMQRLNYPRQYVRRKFDEYTKKPEPRYGWKTDGMTRPVIIDRYATLISEHIELINDIPTLEEAMTFVYDEKGRPDAISGKHDDLIFSDMIAEQIREQQARKNAKDIKKTKYTKEMWEDYKSASPEERKRIIEVWGEPS